MTSQGEDGFTLIEVVAAIAVLAIAFGYGFMVLSDGASRLGRSHYEEAAVNLAQSLLARQGQDMPVRSGRAAGHSDPFDWAVSTEPYDVGLPKSGSVAAYAISISVEWRDGRVSRHLHLSSVRLGVRDDGS